MKDYEKLFQENRKESARTGEVISTVVNKEDLIEQMPHVAEDDRLLLLTPKQFIHRCSPVTAMTARELLRLVEKNPDHPTSKIYAKACKGLRDECIVTVLTEQVNAIRKDVSAPVRDAKVADERKSN